MGSSGANPTASERPGQSPPSSDRPAQQPRALSTLDLYGGDFVLLAGAEGQAWCDAAERAADRLGIDLEAYCIGGPDDLTTTDGRWPSAYGVTQTGAVLVRPDGIVGWRTAAARSEPEQELEEVLLHLLCRDPASTKRG